MIDRRQFGIGLATLVTAALAARRRRAWGATDAKQRPRAIIQIHIRGGIDAIQCTDPKTKSEVSPRVHRGYEDEHIVRVGDARVGPMLGRMAAYVPHMAIINGVNVATVAHAFGADQYRAMQRLGPQHAHIGLLGEMANLGPDRPVLSELCHMEDEALERLSPGALISFADAFPDLSPAGQTILSQLWQLSQDKVRWSLIDQVMKKELARCSGRGDCFAQDASRRLLEALSKISTYTTTPEIPVHLSKIEVAAKQNINPRRLGKYAAGFEQLKLIIRDTLFVLEHGLTDCVFITTPQDFDTHFLSDSQQTLLSANLFSAIAVLFDQLKATKGPRGVPLSQEVAVVMASELGRYPILNSLAGKDHFPEVPVIMLGPGIRPGVYGATDDLMASTTISLASGKRSTEADAIAPDLGDVGATILDWFGHDPVQVGYSGRRLDFLLA
jgi:uncharacterized protein (DUF1501 family)